MGSRNESIISTSLMKMSRRLCKQSMLSL